MVGNYHFQLFLGPKKTKTGSIWAKSEAILHTHPTSAYTRFEMDWLISFPDYVRKITIFSHFLVIRGRKFGQHCPNQIKSIINTYPSSVYIKFEMDWVISLSDNNLLLAIIGQYLANLAIWWLETQDGHTDGRTDGHSPFLPPLLTSSAVTINPAYFVGGNVEKNDLLSCLTSTARVTTLVTSTITNDQRFCLTKKATSSPFQSSIQLLFVAKN